MSAIQEALAKIRGAKSVDEGDRYSDELARAARENVAEVIELFHTSERNAAALVWCLHGITDPPVIDLYRKAMTNRDFQVRWAAIEGLKSSSDPTLIPIFVAAVKDRSQLVKGVAVEWLAQHGDETAIEPLERLIKLPSMIKNSPGTVDEAARALNRLRSANTPGAP